MTKQEGRELGVPLLQVGLDRFDEKVEPTAEAGSRIPLLLDPWAAAGGNNERHHWAPWRDDEGDEIIVGGCGIGSASCQRRTGAEANGARLRTEDGAEVFATGAETNGLPEHLIANRLEGEAIE